MPAPDHPEFEVRYDVETPERIATSVLQTLPWTDSCHPIVSLVTDEFTSVCPWSGLPDFATITIHYTPSEHLVEQKSLKYFLLSFRNVGILQEQVVARIMGDLRALLNPLSLEVVGDFTSRGGIATHVVATL